MRTPLGKNASAARRLQRVRDLLARPGGWVQGVSVKVSGDGLGYCLSGALSRVNASAGDFDRLRQVYDLGQLSLVAFNDRKTTTQKKILAGLDKAIAIAEGTHEA